jgi:hypothetical protein
MLLALRENGQAYAELPIRAVYEPDGKQTSHFNKAVDSVRIYKKLLGFAAAPMFGSFLALMLFLVLSLACATSAIGNLALAAIAALIGWLPVWLVTPARKAGLAVLVTAAGIAALCAFFVLFALAFGLPPIGAFVLAGVLSAPLGYRLWLGSRCPKKPARTKL